MVLRARSRFKQDASASLLTPLSHHRRSPGCAPSAPVSVLLAVPGLWCFTPRPSRSAYAGGAHEAAGVHWAYRHTDYLADGDTCPGHNEDGSRGGFAIRCTGRTHAMEPVSR